MPETLYYDYEHQCWVRNGQVEKCGHTAPMRGCYACEHHGEPMAREATQLAAVPGPSDMFEHYYPEVE